MASRINSDDDIVTAYRKGVGKGMLKVMAKMGISTLSHTRHKFSKLLLAGDVAEDVLLAPRVVQGAGFDVLADEMQRCHEIGFPLAIRFPPVPPFRGDFHSRRGATHMWNPTRWHRPGGSA